LEHLRHALQRVQALESVRLVSVSRVYETEPWGETDSEHCFLNLAAEIETTLPPACLLTLLNQIEGAMGRRRPTGQLFAVYSPRPIDIDILLFDDRVVSVSDTLQIPHLFMHERRFVLAPLAEIAPDVQHPVLYRSIREILQDLKDMREVEPLELPPSWFS
jgi:2-amino-4-hydroxy-6-hydroxymethyldihydropteridine diphosphokinase